MKNLITICLFIFLGISSTAQDKEGAKKLVDEGVALHDKNEFEKAIAKYDKALELDKDNVTALAEKALSLLSLGKYEESISNCKRAIETHPGEKDLSNIYVSYGNALDALKKPEMAIEVYNAGLQVFPGFYQLYFNKGVTLAGLSNYDESLLCFQNAVQINPRHASSHNAIARLSKMKNKRIPAVLAYCRFLVVEPETKRAEENLATLQKLIMAGVTKNGKNNITISIDPSSLGDTTVDGKHKENNFGSTDMILSLMSGLDIDKKNKKKTEVQRFTQKMELICSSLKEQQKDNSGFYWEYYAPYFIEMKDKDLMETFSYIVYASSGQADVTKWLKKHGKEIDKFYEWSGGYVWKGN